MQNETIVDEHLLVHYGCDICFDPVHLPRGIYGCKTCSMLQCSLCSYKLKSKCPVCKDDTQYKVDLTEKLRTDLQWCFCCRKMSVTSPKHFAECTGSFQIFANFDPKLLDPSTKRGRIIHTLDVKFTTLVEEVMQQITDKSGIPVDQQRLLFAGKQMEHGRTMHDYNVRSEDGLHLLLRMRGGCIAVSSPIEFAPAVQSEMKYFENQKFSADHPSAVITLNLEGQFPFNVRNRLISNINVRGKGKDGTWWIDASELHHMMSDFDFHTNRRSLFRLRRVSAPNNGIPLHLDVCSSLTLHVALNNEYLGGNIITGNGKVVNRPVGFGTVHSDRTVHGVTPMTQGVRYSLFAIESSLVFLLPIARTTTMEMITHEYCQSLRKYYSDDMDDERFLVRQRRFFAELDLTQLYGDEGVAIANDYHRFLIKVGAHQMHEPPSPIVDFLWHTHMQNHTRYLQDCTLIAGCTIIHRPVN